MGLCIEWTGTYDPEMDETYYISPRTGELLAIRGRERSPAERKKLRRKGLVASEQVEHIEFSDGRFDEVPEPVAPTGLFARVRARFLHDVIRFGTSLLPLHIMAGILAVLARILPKSQQDRTQILQLVGWLEGRRRRDFCLVRSMLRWFYLINAGYDPRLVLGVWVPTNNMHAWILLDGKAVGEIADEVMHYQPVTLMRWRVG